MSDEVQPPEEPVIDYGVAGASARREHERRKANREQRVRSNHKRTGGLRLALTDDPRHETAWSSGANGEEQLAAVLERRCIDRVRILHDRRVPRSKANVDHIAVCPTGVWVIDAKNYKGKVEIRKPLFGDATLRIGGRDKTKLVDGVLSQVELVRGALADQPNVPVQGAIGFLGDGLPIWPKMSFNGVPILYPRPLAKRLNQDGPLDLEAVLRLAAVLADQFPRA